MVDMFRPIFLLIQVSIEICLVRISFQRVFGKQELSSKTFW